MTGAIGRLDAITGEIRHLDCGGYPLAYVERGDGPAIVLVHGTLGDCRFWAPQLASLSDAHRAIAPSLRRCWPERWDGAGGGYSIERHASDVTLLAARIAPATTLVGFSRGGAVALEAARTHPSLFARLVLIEPGVDSLVAGAGWSGPGAVARECAASIEAGDVDAGLRRLADYSSGEGTWKRTPGAVRARMRDNARTLVAQAAEVRPVVAPEDLVSLPMPVLLVGGEHGTERCRAILDALSACMPAARRVTVAGASHNLSATHPREFDRLLREFVAST